MATGLQALPDLDFFLWPYTYFHVSTYKGTIFFSHNYGKLYNHFNISLPFRESWNQTQVLLLRNQSLQLLDCGSSVSLIYIKFGKAVKAKIRKWGFTKLYSFGSGNTGFYDLGLNKGSELNT